MSLDDARLADIGGMLPEVAGFSGRLAGIIGSRRTGERSANRQEAVGKEDARLRRMQAARLIGAQKASFAARGVSGGSTGALAAETAQLEILDVGRTLLRSQLFGREMRERGLAAALGHTLGIAQDAALYGGALAQRREIEERRKNTILSPAPLVELD